MTARRARRARTPRLRIAFAASELAPLLQTGGLGDAVAGLAEALAARGHELHCLVPGPASLRSHPRCPPLVAEIGSADGLPDGRERGRWWSGRLGELHLHALELPSLAAGRSLYGGADEGHRFIAFSRAVAARTAALLPQVLVAHDWHAALAVCLLKTLYGVGPQRQIGTVQTVHNNAHHGRYGSDLMHLTGLPSELFRPDGLEFHGDLSLLKGGIVWADRIVAVSPRYAREIQTPEFGEGLDGVYRGRAARLVGIANGIDTRRYDPARDPALAAPFDAAGVAGRKSCRVALLDELGLDEPRSGWLLAAVGRLAEQKGWDVLADALPALIERGASLVLVGDGDRLLADQLRRAASRWPRRVALRIGWDDALARRVYAGADCVLAPSRFEPCGLVQLLAQRYGALPVAHAVGGFVDTIDDGQSGVLFSPLTVAELVAACERAALIYAERGAAAVARHQLSLDVAWSQPAKRWEKLLTEVAAEAAERV